LGCFAAHCLRSAGGGTVGPPRLDTRVSIRYYCSDRRKPQLLVLCGWRYHRGASCARSGSPLCRRAKQNLRARRYFMAGRHGLAALLCFLRLAPGRCAFECIAFDPLANLGNSRSRRAFLRGPAHSSLEPDELSREHLPDEIMTGTVATQSYISTNRCAAVALQHAVERDRFACSLVLVRGPISEAGRDLACDVKTACRFVRGGYTCPALCIVTRNMGQIRGDSWKHDHGFQRVECSLQPPGA